MHAETVAVHGGRVIDRSTGAVTPPIHLSTTFERSADGGYERGFEYSRDDNPNRHSLETCLTLLEGGAGAVAFGSGMAAITAVLEALPAGRRRRVVLPDDMYFGIRALLAETDIPERFEIAIADMTSLESVARVCGERQPGLVWIETPSNPLVKVTDVAAIAAMAREAGAFTCVDNTWATPLLQQPLALGADLALHAVTKYLGGHGDLMAGAVVVREDGDFLTNLRRWQRHKGAVPSPFDCWLALRGLQSLAPRMRTHCENAAAVARFLSEHPAVKVVHFPGLPADPGHVLAKRQMRDFGAMLSFEVYGGRPEAFAVAATVRLITRATSLGGAHSLIEHRASVEGPNTKAPEALLRLSVGLEHPDDLKADLGQALRVLT